MDTVLRAFTSNSGGTQSHGLVVSNNARLCLSRAGPVWLDRHGSMIEYSIASVCHVHTDIAGVMHDIDCVCV